MDVKEQELLGPAIDGHWYYRAKSAAMLRLLRGQAIRRVLDIGAGSGFFARRLLACPTAEEAICVDPAYRAERDETADGKPLRFRRDIDRIDADLVLMMDVLEHVDDDRGMLAGYVGRVPSNTLFLISVPAFQWLWSGHDVYLEHRRRYTISAIERVIGDAGLVCLTSSYFYALVLPLAAAVRLAHKIGNARETRSDLRRHHPVVNSLLAGLCRIELPLLGRNRLGGLSIFCVARRP